MVVSSAAAIVIMLRPRSISACSMRIGGNHGRTSVIYFLQSLELFWLNVISVTRFPVNRVSTVLCNLNSSLIKIYFVFLKSLSNNKFFHKAMLLWIEIELKTKMCDWNLSSDRLELKKKVWDFSCVYYYYKQWSTMRDTS